MGKHTIQEHIFDLIWSLSNAEKKYARKHYLSGNDDADFVKIFDIIERSKGKPIAKVQKKLEGIANLSRKKNYLLDVINNTLYQFSPQQSISNQVQKDILIIDALIHKNLLSQAAKMIKQNKKKAHEIEDFNALIRLIELEKIIINQNESKRKQEILSKLSLEETLVHDNLRMEQKYGVLRNKIWETIKNEGKLPYLHLLQEIEDIMGTPYFHDENFAHTFKSKCEFNNAKHMFQDLIGKSDLALIFIKNQCKLYDDHAIMKSEKKYNYLTALNSYCNTEGQAGNIEKALEGFDKMLQVDCNTPFLKLKQFEYVAANKLGLLVDHQVSIHYPEFIEFVEEGLKIYADDMNKLYRVVCIYNMSNHYLYSGNYKEALRYNYMVLNDSYSFRKDIQKFARLLQVIIHIELGNYDNLEYYLNSIKRYFSEQSNLFAIESWFLEFLKEYTSKILVNEKSAIQYLKNKEPELDALQEGDSWRKVTAYFDFRGWFDYKLHGKKMMKESIK